MHMHPGVRDICHASYAYVYDGIEATHFFGDICGINVADLLTYEVRTSSITARFPRAVLYYYSSNILAINKCRHFEHLEGCCCGERVRAVSRIRRATIMHHLYERPRDQDYSEMWSFVLLPMCPRLDSAQKHEQRG